MRFVGIQELGDKRFSMIEDDDRSSHCYPIEDRYLLLKSSMLVNIDDDCLGLLGDDQFARRKEMLLELEAIQEILF
jgi:hypothetical protein